jgi:hypothetical protein
MRPGAGDRLLVCHAPGFDRYETTAASIALIDVAPTLLALLGHRPVPTMRGRSVMRRRARAAATPAAAS